MVFLRGGRLFMSEVPLNSLVVLGGGAVSYERGAPVLVCE